VNGTRFRINRVVPSKSFRLPVMRLTRLLLLGLLGCAVLPSTTVSAATAKDKVKVKVKEKALPRNAPVEMIAVNGKEKLALRLRDDKGRPLRGVQKRFDHFLRCHHTNVAHPMNPRLVRVLYQVGKHYPGKTIEVVSGYRHPSVAKNPRSPHMQGLACDFRVNGVKNTELRDYLRRGFEKVGVGYYPNSSFVHLDMRKDRSAFWIDYSGPGDRAMYSDNPLADVKSGRADTFKPTKIGRGWAEGTDYGGAATDEEAGDDGAPGEGESGAGTGPGPDTSAASGAKDRGTTSAPAAPPAPGSDNANVNAPVLGSVARK
jgi:uncharacterized protein YcbK (DUF882 family)